MRPLFVALILAAPVAAADPLPVETEVEGQPLAANAARVARALADLGAPLPADAAKKLAAVGNDPAAVQRVLDPRVLLAVGINPESRVRVARGPAPATLQQGGFLPVLVKVVNEAGVTKPLRIASPHSGPVQNRAPDWHTRDGRFPKGPDLSGRFLQVAMATDPPLTPDLSGLRVEYAVALIYSSESGKREATIGFALDPDDADLGFRSETAVLFDVAPAVRVTLRVADADGSPTVGRFTFRRPGIKSSYPPQPKRVAPDLFFQPQVYRADGEIVLLPPGPLTMEFGRGPEYKVSTTPVTIPAAATHEIAVKLERWIDPLARGWVSGDHHIHSAGCSHYTNPTEGVAPADMFRYVKGEGLNVGCCLTWGPCYDFQKRFFGARPDPLSDPKTVIKYDVEVSGFGSQLLGHVCLLNLREMDFPGSDGRKSKGWPTWTTPLMRWAKQQGAVTGYAHSGNGLAIAPQDAAGRLLTALDTDKDGHVSPAEGEAGPWPLPEPFARLDADRDGKLSAIELVAGHTRSVTRLPNLAVPQMNGIGAQEICVTSAQGLCDFISTMDTDRTSEWNCWYHIMNCGFPLKASGETDFPCVSGDRVGQGRVYVQMGKIDKIDFGEWCEGVRRGRSYVSDGYAHALDFRVNGAAPGGDAVALADPGEVGVTATVAFAAETPLGTSVGGRIPPGKTRKVELVVNGRAVASESVPTDGKPHDLSFKVRIDRSSWVALRQFPTLHTNPVSVLVGGKPIRASRDSAKWCVGVIEQLWKVRGQKIADAERPEAEQTFKQAVETYRRIAAVSPMGS